MTNTAIFRVAISQCIIFSILCYVFILLGLSMKGDQVEQYNIGRNAFFVMSGYFIFPLICALVLLIAAYREKLELVRTWITVSIFNTIILLCLLMCGAIRASWSVDVFWSIILIAIPILLTIWIFDHIIIVVDCHKKLEQQQKQENSKIAVIQGISLA